MNINWNEASTRRGAVGLVLFITTGAITVRYGQHGLINWSRLNP